ncbi:hypothetical protein [Spartinivicinus ruber]|uniref:hypothetical protein n=1 Tax=Spartinivicinus ruber TaxID=2683272 RepID=UPI0013D4E9F0|nr:hypothetical protein [Spartinivicinus ruber]
MTNHSPQQTATAINPDVVTDEPSSHKPEVIAELYDVGLTDACHILEQLDYDLLSMKQIPTDKALENAKNIRVLWFICCYIASVLFLFALLGFFPRWTGGLLGAVLFLLGLTYIDNLLPLIPGANRFILLTTKRKQLELELKKYIKTIEGSLGYIHLLQPLSCFNSSMEKHYFKRLCAASEQHLLMKHLINYKEFQLYYQYLIEALAANEKRKAWLKKHPEPNQTNNKPNDFAA